MEEVESEGELSTGMKPKVDPGVKAHKLNIDNPILLRSLFTGSFEWHSGRGIDGFCVLPYWLCF